MRNKHILVCDTNIKQTLTSSRSKYFVGSTNTEMRTWVLHEEYRELKTFRCVVSLIGLKGDRECGPIDFCQTRGNMKNSRL
jgi:hypothetical protein